jgi:hypothetical protein
MHRALRISEVVRCILEELDGDGYAMRAAMLVSRAWAAEATPLLWRSTTVSALAALPADRRRQLAAKVRSLSLDVKASDADAAAIATVALSRLAKLCLRSECVTPDVFFERCPALQELHISRWSFGTRDDIPLGLLLPRQGNTDSLRSVYIHPPVSAPVLVQLARMRRLERLQLGSTLSYDVAAAAATAIAEAETEAERIPAPFPRLHRLFTSVQAVAVPVLVPLLTGTVRILRLDLQASVTASSLPSVATLRHLVELKLCFPSARRNDTQQFVETDGLVALSGLAELEVLEITVTALVDTDLTDADLSALATGLPRLRRLVFGLHAHRLTVAGLAGLGRHCRQLQYLWMDGAFALDALEGEAAGGPDGSADFRAAGAVNDVAKHDTNSDGTGSNGGGNSGRALFPELLRLRVRSAVAEPSRSGSWDSSATAAKIVSVLAHHAPTLESLWLTRENFVDAAVLNQWGQSGSK